MTPMLHTSNANGSIPGLSRFGETCAPEAKVSIRQGTNAVRGTWKSEGEAGRHLRTTAGQAGITPVGPGTPSPVPIPLRLERIATQAHQSPDMACPTLAHHVDMAMLGRAFRSLNPTSAPGADRVTWQAYKNTLETHRETFHEKLVDGTYCPQPVVRRLIPTSHGTLRPLGLPALEDTMVAKAVARLLEPMYEAAADVVYTVVEAVLVANLLIPQHLVQELRALVEPEHVGVSRLHQDLEARIAQLCRAALRDRRRIVGVPVLPIDRLTID